MAFEWIWELASMENFPIKKPSYEKGGDISSEIIEDFFWPVCEIKGHRRWVRLSFHSTRFEIFVRIADRPEQSEGSENLYFETRIGEKVHEWKKSEVRCECQSTARAPRKNRPEKSWNGSNPCLFMEVFVMSESESFIEESYEKERKSNNHKHREAHVSVGK